MGEIMKIITRFRFDGSNGFLEQGRAYIHPSNYKEVYGYVQSAVNHLKDVLESPELKVFGDKHFSWINAIIWGNQKREKAIDFFGYKPHPADGWPGNPDVFSCTTVDSKIVSPKAGILEITCGQGLRIVGEEEKYRQTTESLAGYLERPPTIEGLEFQNRDFATIQGMKEIGKPFPGRTV